LSFGDRVSAYNSIHAANNADQISDRGADDSNRGKVPDEQLHQSVYGRFFRFRLLRSRAAAELLQLRSRYPREYDKHCRACDRLVQSRFRLKLPRMARLLRMQLHSVLGRHFYFL